MTTELPRMTCRSSSERVGEGVGEWEYTHHHAEPGLLSIVLLLDGVVQHNVEEYLSRVVISYYGSSTSARGTHVVTSEDTDDFAASVQLDKEPLVEILRRDG